MNIPEKIDSILAQRKKLLPLIDQALDNARHARDVVERLDRYRAAGTNTPEVAAKLAAIDMRPFYTQQEKAVQQLEQLHSRFSRDEISISFVGLAGQGKSLVLQRISGLDGNIIPSADGSDCTGAKSTISNHPNTNTQAEITFYSESEYTKIVEKYLAAIFPSDSDRPKVESISDISNLDLQMLQEKISSSDNEGNNVKENTLFRHLKKYAEHVQELREYFGTKQTVPESRIESFVAQYKSQDKSQKYYTYLGVKEARIITSFPKKNCGKILLT